MEIENLTNSDRTRNIKSFIKQWNGTGYKEDGSTAPFWTALLRNVFGVQQPEKEIKFEETFKHEEKGNALFCDARLPETHVIIEQKAPGIPLDVPYKRHGREFKSVYEQAYEYDQTLGRSERSKYIIACNFHEFWIYDMELPEAKRQPVKVLLKDLEKDYKKLAILVNKDTKLPNYAEVEVSVKAGEKVGKLYDLLLAEFKKYGEVTKEDLHALNVLCVRIVFCLYAEDAGLFNSDAFANYIASFRPENVRGGLIELFKILDQPKEERDRFLSEKLDAFPYVNGGLFQNMNVTVPPITPETQKFIVEEMSQNFNWADISPTIFGAVFESTLNPETRRKGGMHYTSIENIHKVIDPLFLDELKEKVNKVINETPEDKKRNEKRHEITLLSDYKKRLHALQAELAGLKFLDPACGSGNFLTETYLSLRRLENRILAELFGGETFQSAFIDDNYIQVSIGNFYGIEINDFAVTVAKTALWIAESQMFQETQDLLHLQEDFLPLKSNINIHEGNALRLDWAKIVPKMELNYIIGNPPFVGYSLQSKEQKEDILSIYVDENGKSYKTAGKIDFVAGWYFKAADMMIGTSIRTAFVSTNSITQGEQVTAVWQPLYKRFGIHIDFAYRTFRWDSEASLKAHVHCVIVGFSCTGSTKKKYIFSGEKKAEAQNINPYIFPSDIVWIKSRNKPICDVPGMSTGNRPADGGHLIIEADEYEAFIKKEPKAQQYIKKFMGAQEYLNNKKRYCLWLVGVSPAELRSMPEVMKRIEACKQNRLMGADDRKKLADTPALFREIKNPAHFLVIPEVSSERRKYIPIGYLDNSTIPNNKIQMIENSTLYHFGILTSNVHMAWVRTIAGRLGTSFDYSKNIVYNNFPWPKPTEEQKKKIELTAQAILDVRSKFPDSSLADLYDPLIMPAELLAAHRANDRAVWEAYGKAWDIKSESACVAYLMQLYQKLIDDEKQNEK